MRAYILQVIGGVLLISLTACGGGGGSPSSIKTNGNTSLITGPNTAPLIIDTGPAGLYTVNELFTSVTVCDSTAATNCQTIDHILVDTGSSGLRIISSVLSPSLSLPQQTDASSNPIGECGMFVDGYTWGPVKIATMKIANEVAYSIPIQVIGDPTFAPVPAICSSSGTGISENTVATFGANGVLGVGNFLQDCGPYCVSIANAGVYYSCAGAICQSVTMSLDQQLPNPVALFDVDNNGVIVNLPAVPSGGAANVGGSLVFGIGTQTNNELGSTQILTLDPNIGYLTTVFNNQTLVNSFVDSGSNALFFPAGNLSGTLVNCTAYPYFYCPASTQNFSALIQGTNAAQATINFSVANAYTLVNSVYGITAFNNLAGTNVSTSFDWGLPFFYGRNVYVINEGQNVGGSTGPFLAF